MKHGSLAAAKLAEIRVDSMPAGTPVSQVGGCVIFHAVYRFLWTWSNQQRDCAKAGSVIATDHMDDGRHHYALDPASLFNNLLPP